MGSLLASNVQAPQGFQLPGMGGAASGAFGGIQNLQNTYGGLGGSVLPFAQQTASNLYNNPYAVQGQQGANFASGLGENAALTGFNTGGGLIGAGQNIVGAGMGLLPYAQPILQAGFDPQNALYNRTLQRVQDQSNVNNAMSGVATSPYGAGLTNQATGNFNIDWQNNLLNRMSSAAGAAGGLVNTGAGAAQTGAGITGQGVGMMNQAPNQFVQSAMIPYATYSDIGTGQNQALSQLLGLGQSGANLSNLPIQDFLSYLGIGNQANQVANQRFADQLKQNELGFNEIGSLLSGGAGILGMIPGLGSLGSLGMGGAGAVGPSALAELPPV